MTEQPIKEAEFVRIRMKTEVDQDPDLSYLGHFATKDEAFKVDRSKYIVIDRFPDYDEHYLYGNLSHAERNEYRYFVGSDNYTGETPENREQYTREDMKRVEEYSETWGCIGVSVVAEFIVDIGNGYKRHQEFQSSGIWGVEDSWDKESRDYIRDIAKDELEELKDYVKAFGLEIPNDAEVEED